MAALLPLFSKATIIPKLQTFRATVSTGFTHYKYNYTLRKNS